MLFRSRSHRTAGCENPTRESSEEDRHCGISPVNQMQDDLSDETRLREEPDTGKRFRMKLPKPLKGTEAGNASARKQTAPGAVIASNSPQRLQPAAVGERSERSVPFWKWLWWRAVAAPPKFLKMRVTTRVSAIGKIVESADPRGETLLLGLIGDPWVVVREAVASGLGKLKSTTAVPDLCRLVTSDDSPQVRRIAAQSLAEIGRAHV